MGVYANLQSQRLSFDADSPFDRYLTSLLQQYVDPAVPAAAAETDAVHTIAQDATDHTGGTFTLTITNRAGDTFTTAGIAYNANAATIEGAIDTAATSASFPGWTNGDISVSGGILQAAGAPVVLTFDGDSVDGENLPITVFDGSSLTGGAEPATRVTITTQGQTERNGLGFLIATGVITSATIPVQTDPATENGVTKGNNLLKVPPVMITAAAKEAAFEDGNNDTYVTIVAGLGYDDRAPRAEKIGTSSIL